MKLPLIFILLLISGLTFAQDRALQVGDTAPSFSGINQFDSIVNSELILEGSAHYVLIFYRGSWCKYCRKHLSAMADSLHLILAKNATVIVVTPENTDSREKMESETDSRFSIISDTSYSILKAFKVDYIITTETVPRFTGHVIEMTEKSTGKTDGVLPIPATYIVGKDGVIKWAHVDSDYTHRSSVKQILDAL